MIIGLIVQGLLLALKLTGAVSWSWWVVMSPVVVLVAIIVFVIVCVIALMACAKFMEWQEKDKLRP